MPRVYFDEDVDPSPLARRRVAILGYGAQGRAQALNLRDSGVDVIVGLRSRSAHRRMVRSDGLPCAEIGEASRGADLVMLLVPDESQAALFREVVEPALKTSAVVGFSHGFTVHFGLLRTRAPRELILVAPKGPGSTLRQLYLAGTGLPALVAAEPRTSRTALRLALAYARAIGCGRAGIVRSSFEDETVTDLFGEQAVLTGGIAELARAAFETLVARGYPPEIAYIECVQEIRGLAEIMFERGIAGMREVVSSPAAWGGMRSGRRVIGRDTRRRLENLLDEIESGGTMRWLRGLRARDKQALRSTDREHEIERAGQWVRSKLRWDGAGTGVRRRSTRRRRGKRA